MDEVSKVCASTASWTTDGGVEHLLCRTPASVWSSINPQVLSSDQPSLYVDDSDPLATQSSSSPRAKSQSSSSTQLFGEALPVSGLLHVMNNASKDIGSSLKSFRSWCEQASALTSFLRHRWTRELFVERCLHTPLGEIWRPAFESFGVTLVQWRFNSAYDVAECLLELQAPLQTFWSADLSSLCMDEYHEFRTWSTQNIRFRLTRIALFLKHKRSKS